MLFLILAIACSALLPVLFRAFSELQVDVFSAIPANYLACTILGAFLVIHQLDVATLERLQSQSMTDALHQPFTVAALARGVAPRDVIVRHAWRVSLRPICAIYGLAIGALLSGSFVVEFVTAWPGLGQLMYEALRARDIYLVTGCAPMGAFLLALGTLIGDLLLATVDPRTRETEAA